MSFHLLIENEGNEELRPSSLEMTYLIAYKCLSSVILND